MLGAVKTEDGTTQLQAELPSLAPSLDSLAVQLNTEFTLAQSCLMQEEGKLPILRENIASMFEEAARLETAYLNTKKELDQLQKTLQIQEATVAYLHYRCGSKQREVEQLHATMRDVQQPAAQQTVAQQPAAQQRVVAPEERQQDNGTTTAPDVAILPTGLNSDNSRKLPPDSSPKQPSTSPPDSSPKQPSTSPPRKRQKTALCLKYNSGDRCSSGCPGSHRCLVCNSNEHPFFRCMALPERCGKYNRDIPHRDCTFDHRCSCCASAEHTLVSCPLKPPQHEDFCLCFGNTGLCKVAGCDRRHRCLRCRAKHPSLRCPKNADTYGSILTRLGSGSGGKSVLT